MFSDASGINPHFGVQLNGVDVGSVTGVSLATGGARVKMAINPGVSVPSNVTASIDVANDLGEQVIELTPGAKPAPPLRVRRDRPLDRRHPGRHRQGRHRGGQAR